MTLQQLPVFQSQDQTLMLMQTKWASILNPLLITSSTATLVYPGSAPDPIGKYIALLAPSTLKTGYSITLPTSNTLKATGVLSYTTANVITPVTYDTVGTSMTSTGANAVAASRTRSTGTTVGIGGVAISSSSGSFSTSATTPTAVTNLSVTITTSGRPVSISLMSASASNSFLEISGAAASLVGLIYIYKQNAALAEQGFGMNLNSTYTTGTLFFDLHPSSVNYIDTPAAGTYTYDIRAAAGITGQLFKATNCKLVVYEL